MPPQTPQLRQISSTQGQTTFPLSQNQAITIGRDTTCQIVLDSAQYQGVSRRHAEIRPSAGGGFEVSDLGSSNGTLVNGQRLQQPRSLQPGDTIQLGQAGVQFVFEAPLSQAPSPLGATMVEGQPGYPPPATPSYPPAAPAYPPAYPQQPVYAQTPPALVHQQTPASNNTGKWIGAGVAIVLVLAGLNAKSLFGGSAPARQPATNQPTATQPNTPASDQPTSTDQPSDQPTPASNQPNSNARQVDTSALDRSFKVTSEFKEQRNQKVTTNSKNFTADILVFEIEAKSSFDPRQSWFGARFLDANGKEVGDPSLLYVENPPNQWSSGDRRSVFIVLPSDRSSLRTVQLIPFTRRN